MTTYSAAPRFVPVSDHALLVEFSAETEGQANTHVLALDRALAMEQIDGVCEIVPAIVNLLLVFDPILTEFAEVETQVRSRLTMAPGEAVPTRRHEVLICYDEAVAPDLPAVARASDLSIEATITAHLAGDYRVVMYGFAPGYAYLAGVPETIRVPRKATATRDIAAGSVIVAGPQCLITTLKMPTGWSIIGRSPTPILLDDPEQPFRFDPGDRVSFTRIDLAAFDRIESGR